VCKKFLKNNFKNNFLLKLCVRIPTTFGTKHDKFQLKRKSLQLEEKIKQFHTQTFLSTLAVMNEKFIANIVEDI